MSEPRPISPDHPVLVEVVRGDLVECIHRARVAVTAPDGTLLASIGDVTHPMYSRSSLKPVQALAMLRSGLDLDRALLALAGASHSGQDHHLQGVQQILDGAGLSVDDLQNTADLPLHKGSREAWLRAGGEATSFTQNCSGKHAAMLRTCVRAGWPTSDYRDPQHPLQQAIATTVDEYCGGHAPSTIDGCGAPLFATPLQGLAAAFGRIAGATDGQERLVADAFRNHPEYASGEGRDDLDLHRAVPGLVCKGGAEACMAVGLADGRGLAIKVDDGDSRGLLPLTATILQAMVDAPGLAALTSRPVLGHGEPVGVVRVAPGSLDALTEALRAS